MDATAFLRGQKVLVGDRPAVFLELNGIGSPIVRFAGEQQTRVVPLYKLRANHERSRQRSARTARSSVQAGAC